MEKYLGETRNRASMGRKEEPLSSLIARSRSNSPSHEVLGRGSEGSEHGEAHHHGHRKEHEHHKEREHEHRKGSRREHYRAQGGAIAPNYGG